ncbi:MAG: hypothetical protein F4Z81_11875 [Gemmatimonadetes bacterium]|nr:hypothetical protein [Gemmatimonadota bacterium]MYB62756.1 hypothetical protein [Gemmatimonadota bacterium]
MNEAAKGPDSSEFLSIPEPAGVYAEPWTWRKFRRMLGFFGPAALVASMAVGAGETILVTGVGAWAEYGLLWLILLSVLVKGVAVTYLLGRFTAVSGQPFGRMLAKLPGPRGWFIMTLLTIELLALSIALTAVAKPCGNLVVHIFSDSLPAGPTDTFWANLVTTGFLGLAIGLSLLTSYEFLEKQQIIICGVLVSGTILATVIVWPSLGGVLIGTLSIGNLLAAPDWAPIAARNDYFLNLVTVFGYVGGTLSTYLAYSGWVAQRGWGLTTHAGMERLGSRIDHTLKINYLKEDPSETRRMRVLLTPLKWDVSMGAIVLFIVTAAFMIAGAVVLYPRQTVLPGNAWDLLTRQSSIWAQIHAALIPVYYVAILAALWGTLATIPEALTRFAHEFLTAVWPRFKSYSYRRLQTWIVIWFFVSSAAAIWSDITFDLITQIVALLATNLGVGIVCCAAVYLNFKLPPAYRTRPAMLVLGVLSTVVLLSAFVVSAAGMLQK